MYRDRDKDTEGRLLRYQKQFGIKYGNLQVPCRIMGSSSGLPMRRDSAQKGNIGGYAERKVWRLDSGG